MQLTAGVFATAGLRGADRMEDCHVIRENLQDDDQSHLLAVFDGHRGPQAAQYAAQHIVEVLQQQLQGRAPREALSTSFLSIDEAFRSALLSVQSMSCEQAGLARHFMCHAHLLHMLKSVNITVFITQ